MTEPELDALLKKPLDDVADGGFSRGVGAEIARRARADSLVEWGAALVTFLLIVLFVPLGRVAAPFETLGVGLALSLPFAVACAALALSLALVRAVAD